jgi:hypothetical protein
MEARWTELSAAVATWHDRMLSDEFRAGQLAAMIGNAFGTYIQAPNDPAHVRFFRYAAGYDPDHDEYELVDNAMAAVSNADDGRWVFALGVVLERAPGASPKFDFHWPMYITLDDPPVVDVGGDGTWKQCLTQVDGHYNLEPLSAELFSALKSLLAGEKQSLRIGFNPINS